CCAWPSASETVSTVAGTVRPNVANPRRERAFRREITPDLRLLMTKLLHLRRLTLLIRNEPRMNKHEQRQFAPETAGDVPRRVWQLPCGGRGHRAGVRHPTLRSEFRCCGSHSSAAEMPMTGSKTYT